MINQPNQINLDRRLDTAFVLASGREDTLYRIANGTKRYQTKLVVQR